MSSAQLKKFATVKPAEIEWRNGLPFSTEFNDVYFSVYGAVEESQHVFIDGNHLTDDWKDLEQDQFYIAELGFGSGLNFLNTAHHWRAHLAQHDKHCGQHLHYIAIEKRPFSPSDFEKTSKLWSQFSDLSSQLLCAYPSQTYGRHQIHFPQWRLTLTLMLMPLEDAFDDLIKESRSQQNKIKIDHWFLDGFAPTKNTSMWSENNAQKIAQLSKVGTRLATYSVAASVKKPLIKVGFEINKRKGFAKKREMLTAILKQPHVEKKQSKFINIKYENPWINIARNNIPNDHERIAIIGGGIAGCSTAYSLSQKGFNCDLFEAHSNIAQGASGAAAGIFHPQLSSDMNIGSQFNWLAYLTLLRFLSSMKEDESQSILLSQGVQRFLENKKIAENFKQLCSALGLTKWITRSSVYPDNERCMYFPHSAVVNMSTYCQVLLDKISNEQLCLNENSKIENIKFNDGYWRLSTLNKTYQYKQVIFCGGAKSNLLEQLNITARNSNTTRGQTCYFNSKILSAKIKNTLCEKIYIVPKDNDHFHLGTTFEDFEDDCLNNLSQNDMLNRTSKFLKEVDLPQISQHEIESIELAGTVGYRLHSSDRLPIVGAAINQEKLFSDFQNLGQKKLSRDSISHYNLPGLWINTAYGSHGLLYSLIASQHLCSLISNDISPLQNYISNALHPARFFIRDLKTN